MSRRSQNNNNNSGLNIEHEKRLSESDAFHKGKEEVTVLKTEKEVVIDSRGKKKTVEKSYLSNGNIHSRWLGSGDLT